VGFVRSKLLATDWIPFGCLVAIDRAIAGLVGGDPQSVFRELGRHSALMNLGGVYKNFVADEPHRFFQQMTLLHGRFQNFGNSAYVKTGDRSGRIRIDGYMNSPSSAPAAPATSRAPGDDEGAGAVLGGRGRAPGPAWHLFW
jgi:hypothetical protein